MKAIKTIQEESVKFFSGYYTFVMAFFLILFAFRPHDQSVAFIASWKLLFTIAFLSSIFNKMHETRAKLLAVSFAFPSLLLGWAELIFRSEILFVFSSVCTIIFMWICTSMVIRDVTVGAKVTLETLRGVICAYFMIAFVFSYMYYLLEFAYPGSFHLIARSSPPTPFFTTHDHFLSQLMYFSFITLLTIGFGDITPLIDLSQTVVIVEGLIGQFYVAILVARIVSVYSFR